MGTYERTLRGIDRVDFPPEISLVARDFIEKLCRNVPGDRMGMRHDGVAGIKNHQFFRSFDWPGLGNCQLIAPFVPQVFLFKRCSLNNSRFDCRQLESPISTQYFEQRDDVGGNDSIVLRASAAKHTALRCGSAQAAWDNEF
jgi:hypothetical protein